jgi:hypothetical protein
MKELDTLLQRIQDGKDKALFARLKAAGPKASKEEIQALIDAARALGIGEGMPAANSREAGDDLLHAALDSGAFDENLDVKPELLKEEV